MLLMEMTKRLQQDQSIAGDRRMRSTSFEGSDKLAQEIVQRQAGGQRKLMNQLTLLQIPCRRIYFYSLIIRWDLKRRVNLVLLIQESI